MYIFICTSCEPVHIHAQVSQPREVIPSHVMQSKCFWNCFFEQLLRTCDAAEYGGAQRSDTESSRAGQLLQTVFSSISHEVTDVKRIMGPYGRGVKLESQMRPHIPMFEAPIE